MAFLGRAIFFQNSALIEQLVQDITPCPCLGPYEVHQQQRASNFHANTYVLCFVTLWASLAC